MGMIAYLLRVSPAELDAYCRNSNLLQERVNSTDIVKDPAFYDVDKSWDGIIFLLTGSNSSDATQFLSCIFFSERLIDEQQDLGTGPAHYLLPDEVAEVHQVIAGIAPQALKERFDPVAMKAVGVYPNNVWDEAEVDDYLAEYFETVREAFAAAVAGKEAIITFVR